LPKTAGRPSHSRAGTGGTGYMQARLPTLWRVPVGPPRNRRQGRGVRERRRTSAKQLTSQRRMLVECGKQSVSENPKHNPSSPNQSHQPQKTTSPNTKPTTRTHPLPYLPLPTARWPHARIDMPKASDWVRIVDEAKPVQPREIRRKGRLPAIDPAMRTWMTRAAVRATGGDR